MITFRNARKTDMEFARYAHHLAFREVVEAQYGPWNEMDQDRFFEDGWNYIGTKIIQIDKENCGFLVVEYDKDEIRIMDIVIIPKYQNKGIGSKIVKNIIEEARVKNLPLKLQTHLKNRAVNFYKRLGFHIIGQTETHYQMLLTGNTK